MTAELLIAFPRLGSSNELVSFQDLVVQSFSRDRCTWKPKRLRCPSEEHYSPACSPQVLVAGAGLRAVRACSASSIHLASGPNVWSERP